MPVKSVFWGFVQLNSSVLVATSNSAYFCVTNFDKVYFKNICIVLMIGEKLIMRSFERREGIRDNN